MNEIMIEKSKLKDIDRFIAITNNVRKNFAKQNIDQWQGNYPAYEDFMQDIFLEESYKIIYNEKIVGMFMLSYAKEPTYKTISNGTWLNDDDYAVIHRIAIDPEFQRKDIGKESMLLIEKLIKENNISNIRIDTHKDNEPMIHLLDSLGFIKCGVIQLREGSYRIAYQKQI